LKTFLKTIFSSSSAAKIMPPILFSAQSVKWTWS